MVNITMDLFAHRLLSRNFSQKQLTSQTTSPVSETRSSPVSPTISEAASPKNKVTFCHEVKVVLIPTKEEYHKAKLACDIWFQEHEYQSIKGEIASEVRDFILEQANKKNFMTVREATRMLYHPENTQTSESDSEPSSALLGTFSH